MATKLEAFPTSDTIYTSKYARFLDGSAWSVKRGEDYTNTTHSFLMGVRSAAKKRGLTVRTTQQTETSVIFQCYKKG